MIKSFTSTIKGHVVLSLRDSVLPKEIDLFLSLKQNCHPGSGTNITYYLLVFFRYLFGPWALHFILKCTKSVVLRNICVLCGSGLHCTEYSTTSYAVLCALNWKTQSDLLAFYLQTLISYLGTAHILAHTFVEFGALISSDSC